MQRIAKKTEAGEQMYHHTSRLDTGEMWEGRKTYVVTNMGRGDAYDEYGTRNSGFFYTLREATAEELAKREQENAEWNAKTPEERVEIQFSEMAEAWGDR